MDIAESWIFPPFPKLESSQRNWKWPSARTFEKLKEWLWFKQKPLSACGERALFDSPSLEDLTSCLLHTLDLFSLIPQWFLSMRLSFFCWVCLFFAAAAFLSPTNSLTTLHACPTLLCKPYTSMSLPKHKVGGASTTLVPVETVGEGQGWQQVPTGTGDIWHIEEFADWNIPPQKINK